MIRIYPTISMTCHKYLENGQLTTLNYQVVSLNEYLRSLDIDPFYIETLTIHNNIEVIHLNNQQLKSGYLGYLDNPKSITLLFPKDNSGQSWLTDVADITIKYKQNMLNWGDEDDV